MHHAVIVNSRQIVNLLVKNYADVLIQDANLQTPMHLICMKGTLGSGNLELFKIILE